jgi:hypothetical protein
VCVCIYIYIHIYIHRSCVCVAVVGQDEAHGCEQLCSEFIYDCINNFTTDEKVMCKYIIA